MLRWMPWVFPILLVLLCLGFYVKTHETMAVVMAVLIALVSYLFLWRGRAGGGFQ